MSKTSLKEVAISGMIWNALQKYIILGVSFFSSIILARLLTPYDYGCIGMLEIFISIATIMIDGGFGAALLQKKRPTEYDYSTIFYWNLIISSILYIALFFLAPIIARFYDIPLLSSVLRIQGIVLFINALKMVQSNQLRKKFQFKPIAVTVITSSVISVSVTIIMAYMGYGVWSLVVQQLLIAFLPMVSFWFITRWKPILYFSTSSFKELFHFGGFMFLTEIAETLSNNLQGLLIGRFYDASTMGYYAKAKTTEGLASNGISQVVKSVTLQLYAEVQDDTSSLRNILKRITVTLAYFTSPIIVFLMLVAMPLFIILYSNRWAPCVPYFRILALAGLALCLQAVNLQAIAAIGKSKTMFSWTLIKKIVNITLLLIGLLIEGIKGLLISMVIGTWISFFINAWLVDKHIGYSLKTQLRDLMPIMIVTLSSAFPGYILYKLLSFDVTGPFIAAIVFLGLYYVLSKIFRLEAYTYSKELIPLLVKKIRKNKK